jgi:hypothetical protein
VNGQELVILATMAAPVLLICALIARDGWRDRRQRRRQRSPERPGQHRLGAGRAEATSDRRPSAAPATSEPAPADEPTEPLAALPSRVHPYVQHLSITPEHPSRPPINLLARFLRSL